MVLLIYHRGAENIQLQKFQLGGNIFSLWLLLICADAQTGKVKADSSCSKFPESLLVAVLMRSS